jgi:hypothetical protein
MSQGPRHLTPRLPRHACGSQIDPTRTMPPNQGRRPDRCWENGARVEAVDLGPLPRLPLCKEHVVQEKHPRTPAFAAPTRTELSPPGTTARPQPATVGATSNETPSAAPAEPTEDHAAPHNYVAQHPHKHASCSGPPSLDLARSSPDLAWPAAHRHPCRTSGRSAARAATTAADTAEEARGRRPDALAPPLAARCPGHHAAPAGDPRARG